MPVPSRLTTQAEDRMVPPQAICVYVQMAVPIRIDSVAALEV